MARIHVDFDLRWADQDAYRHINNVAYARYLEEARNRVFELGAAREATGLERHFAAPAGGGLMMLLASQSIEFVRPMHYGPAPATVEMWIGRVGGANLELHAEILDGGAEPPVVCARAVSTVVLVDAATDRPTRMSPEARAAVDAWTDAPLKLRR